MKNLYDDVHLYDIVHGSFADSDTFNFYRKHTEPSGSPVLELASGTGFYLIPLTENNVKITGLDISENMLRACGQKARERNIEVEVLRGDMRDFDLKRKFKTIFIAGNSLQHLYTIEEISACFKCVKRHLETDGKFIVEIINPYIPLLIREKDKRFMIGAFEDYVLTENVFFDTVTQINHIEWHFWHRPTDTEKSLSFSMRHFFPQEFDALFHFNNFRIDEKYGDFDETEFKSDSPKQIVVASLP